MHCHIKHGYLLAHWQCHVSSSYYNVMSDVGQYFSHFLHDVTGRLSFSVKWKTRVVCLCLYVNNLPEGVGRPTLKWLITCQPSMIDMCSSHFSHDTRRPRPRQAICLCNPLYKTGISDMFLCKLQWFPFLLNINNLHSW